MAQHLASCPSQGSAHKTFCREEGSYSIDLKILEQRYKHLQRQLHPDKFSMKSEVWLSLWMCSLSALQIMMLQSHQPVFALCGFFNALENYIFLRLSSLQREKSISEEASSKVNEAYSTLKSPLKHGEYLVSIQSCCLHDRRDASAECKGKPEC